MDYILLEDDENNRYMLPSNKVSFVGDHIMVDVTYQESWTFSRKEVVSLLSTDNFGLADDFIKGMKLADIKKKYKS